MVSVGVFLLLGCQDTAPPRPLGPWPPAVPAASQSIPRLSRPPGTLAAAPHQYEIFVVEKVTGRPIRDAEVLFLPAPVNWDGIGYSERFHSDRLARSGEAFLRRYGSIAATEADGRVRLALTAGAQHFIVRKGNLFAELHTSMHLPDATGTSQHRVELEPLIEFQVRVVDSTGQPMLGIELQVELDDPNSDSAQYYYTDNSRGPITIRWPRYRESDVEIRRLRIVPVILGHASTGVIVDRDDLPSDPVTVVCPPMGRVVIRVKDRVASHRSRWNELYMVTTNDAAEKGVGHSFEHGSLMRSIALPDGRFLLPFVALNRILSPRPIRLSTPGTHSGLAFDPPAGLEATEFAGPRERDETVHITLRQDPEAPILTGQAVDHRGRPHSAARLSVEVIFVRDGSRRSRYFATPTDVNGRFRLRLPKYLVGKRPLKVIGGLCGYWGIPLGFFARADCDLLRRGTEVDLGALVMRRAPFLVSLLLRGDSGGVVRGPHWFQVWRDRGEDDGAWETVSAEHYELRADGSIDYFAQPRSGRWRVVFNGPGGPQYAGPRSSHDPVEFSAGTRRLEIKTGLK